MSVLERRLQLLLDGERYRKVAEEAQRSGRSVAAVIREAIDLRFADDEADHRRLAAGRRFLELTADPGTGREQEWSALKQEIDDDMAAYLDKKLP